MKVVVSATQEGLDADVSPVFGRCPVYVFVDTETMDSESAPNPAMSAPGGAGIQAAQFAVSKGVSAVITGNVGPNAANVLQAAGVTMYPVSGGSVREAVEALKNGRLQPVSGATSGLGAGMGPGMAGGMGRGGGRRMGRGMAGGMGMGAGAWIPPQAPPTTASKPTAEELSELKGLAQSLKEQLDQVSERIQDLEKKD